MIKVFIFLISCLLPFTATAQICAGSLGDPIINETFGSGQNSLPPYRTTFPYVNGCPPKNSYTLNNFLILCGNRTWVSVVGDHTRDLNGNFMLVNGEGNPETVYVDTANNLCGNTVYQFGVWVTSVMTKFACNGAAKLPNLKFQIRTQSGVLLASDSTGLLPIVTDKMWNFYGFSFKTPPNINDAIVSITINPDFGCGNAFAIDDITLRPCSPSVIAATINGSAGPIDVCADFTVPWILNAAYTPGFADPVLQWQRSIDTGKSWVDITGETMLNYTVPHRFSDVVLYRICMAERGNINSLNCRISSNSIYTSVHPLPSYSAPQTVNGCLGKDFYFPPADPSALQILWTGPNGFNSVQANATVPNVQYKDTGIYILKETFYFGCVSLDTFYLKVFPGTTISVQPSYPICEGKSEQLFASATGIVDYKWVPSIGLSNDTIPNPVATPRDSINYKVLITNRYGCKDSAFVQIDVYRNPLVNAGPDKTMLLGDTAKINASVKGTAVNYYWAPSVSMNDGSLITPLVYPIVNSKYTLNVFSIVGCGSASDEVQVKVYNNLYIPNAFTPNSDGKNDKFRILMVDDYNLTQLHIYNMWGQIVFKSGGSNNEWDGSFKGVPQSQGAYVYHLEILAPFRKKIFRQGTILLVR